MTVEYLYALLTVIISSEEIIDSVNVLKDVSDF